VQVQHDARHGEEEEWKMSWSLKAGQLIMNYACSLTNFYLVSK